MRLPRPGLERHCGLQPSLSGSSCHVVTPFKMPYGGAHTAGNRRRLLPRAMHAGLDTDPPASAEPSDNPSPAGHSAVTPDPPAL